MSNIGSTNLTLYLLNIYNCLDKINTLPICIMYPKQFIESA